MRFAGWYGIVVGAMMLAQWAFFILAGAVPELESEPLRIAFHLAAEAATALGLLASGAALLKRLAWGPRAYLLFSGLLVYSCIVSPGYFAQQGQWGFVLMFAGVLGLALVAVRGAWRAGQTIERHAKSAVAGQNNKERA